MSTTTIKWTQNPARCLGIYNGNDKFKYDYLNWSQRLKKVQTELDTWKKGLLRFLKK